MDVAFPRRSLLLGTLATPALLRHARGAEAHVRITRQIGLSYLPFDVMKARALVEAEAARSGAAVTVEYRRVANGSSVNDALIGGNTEFGAVSLGPLLTLRERTRTTLQVAAAGTVDASAAVLNTNQPRIKELRDFQASDRIAMPDVGISYQALLLQMACEQAFGADNVKRLDPLTVSMPHPEAATALLSGRTEVTAHFATAPFFFQELDSGKASKVLASPDIFGGPATFVLLVAPRRVREDSRAAFSAVLAALAAAQGWITANPDDAAEIYVAEQGAKLAPAFVARMLRDPLIRFSSNPENTLRIAEFSFRTGRVKTKIDSWQELFFEDAHHLAGS